MHYFNGCPYKDRSTSVSVALQRLCQYAQQTFPSWLVDLVTPRPAKNLRSPFTANTLTPLSQTHTNCSATATQVTKNLLELFIVRGEMSC